MDLFTNKFSTISLLKHGILQLKWTEKTNEMTNADFKIVNSKYADLSIEHNTNALLVDVRDFKHKFGESLGDWRKAEIIPKYHQAGVSKFAFLHNDEFKQPPNNGDPVNGENFISMHFNSKEESLDWLNN